MHAVAATSVASASSLCAENRVMYCIWKRQRCSALDWVSILMKKGHIYRSQSRSSDAFSLVVPDDRLLTLCMFASTAWVGLVRSVTVTPS